MDKLWILTKLNVSFKTINILSNLSKLFRGLTASSNWRFPIPSVNSGIHHVKNPNPYIGKWGGKFCRKSPIQTDRKCECPNGKCTATTNYIDELKDTFKYSIPKGKCAGM